MPLTEQEKQEIVRYIEADKPLPDKFRFLLFEDKREVELIWNGKAGEQPISADMVETVLSPQLDDLEPTLTRYGYRIKDLVEQFDARPTAIKAMFSNQLGPTRTAALRDWMLRAGLPR